MIVPNELYSQMRPCGSMSPFESTYVLKVPAAIRAKTAAAEAEMSLVTTAAECAGAKPTPPLDASSSTLLPLPVPAK